MINPGMPMPQYQCHKKVWALKIASITPADMKDGDDRAAGIITPVEDGFAPFRVEPDYLAKFNPQVGGYYVVYDDGYQSWSPAEAFEEGYTKLDRQSLN